MAVQGNPYREAAKDELEKIRQDEIQRWIYLREEMAISDERSWMKTAELQGRSEGFAEGRMESIRSTIQMLKSMGHSEEEIVGNLMKYYALSQADAENMVHECLEK